MSHGRMASGRYCGFITGYKGEGHKRLDTKVINGVKDEDEELVSINHISEINDGLTFL